MRPEQDGDAIRSAPVPCVCGKVPNVCYVGPAVWVECAYCGLVSGGHATRAATLREWAEVVAKGREVTP